MTSTSKLPVVLTAAVVFMGAGLLFWVELFFARQALPHYGGTPAVWTTCLLFFQAALLGGYAYAQALDRRLPLEAQLGCHAALLGVGALCLPPAIPEGAWVSLSWPALSLLAALGIGLLLPFLAVSATSTLLQAWYARLGRPDSRDPYWLYAASNSGSLVALLAYPFLVEPLLGLAQQRAVWAWGYGLLGLGVLACGALALRSARATPGTAAVPAGEPPAPTRRTKLRWLLRSFVPACLLYGVTTTVTTDLASGPLLWVAPLALYLLTFVLAFKTQRWFPRNASGIGVAFLVALLTITFLLDLARFDPPWAWLGIHLLGVFCISLFVHRDLVDERPPAELLASFYTWLAGGGLLAGVFCGLLAPLLYDSIVEYPLALMLAGLLLFDDRQPAAPQTWLVRTVSLLCGGVVSVLLAGYSTHGLVSQLPGYLAVLPIAAVLACSVSWGKLRAFHLLAFAFLIGQCAITRSGLVHRERSFFGVHSVVERAGFRNYMSGATVHGRQRVDPARARESLTYYAPGSPIDALFAAYAPPAPRPKRVGVVGLGIGSLALYAKPGETWRFFEIDPTVERIARDPRLFTLLRDAAAPMDVVLGDGRKLLEREAAAGEAAYDVLVIDAFTSDSVPTHLLTEEAFSVYLGRLAPEGVLVLNLASRFLDLEPLVAELARAHGLAARVGFRRATPEDKQQGISSSHWAYLTRAPRALAGLQGWRDLAEVRGGPLWTDDHVDLLSVLGVDKGK